MRDVVWTCDATGVIARRTHHGILSLSARELTFRHGLRTEIIPYDLSSISVSEQRTAMPGHIVKQQATVIRVGPDGSPCFYVLRDGAADEINQQLVLLHAQADAREQQESRLADEEAAAFRRMRESARAHRQRIRQRVQQRCMAQRAQEAAPEPQPPVVKPVSPPILEKQPAVRPGSEGQKPVAAAGHGPVQGTAVRMTAVQQQAILPLIACLEERCEMLVMENVLKDHWFFPEEAAVIARVFFEARARKRPRLFLHTRLRQEFGPEKGSRYYDEIMSFLSI